MGDIPGLCNIQESAICAMETFFFLERDSIRVIISSSEDFTSGAGSDRLNHSVSVRRVVVPAGRANAPPAMGLQGISLPSALPQQPTKMQQIEIVEKGLWGIPYAEFFACGVHFTFFFAVDEIIVILHTDKLCPSIFLSDVLETQELVGIHG